jgi:hypothetical protein
VAQASCLSHLYKLNAQQLSAYFEQQGIRRLLPEAKSAEVVV